MGVKLRKRGRERNKEWVGERNKKNVSDRPCLNYARKENVQHGATATTTRWGKGRSKNWRDAPDILSFYFTKFPNDMGEKVLWIEFKKWSDVREVFISRN